MSNKFIILNSQKQVTCYMSHITQFTGKLGNWATNIDWQIR